jgi:type III pantothenate kinase
MLRGAVDIGNTRIKCAVFDPNGELSAGSSFTSGTDAAEWLQLQRASRIMVSSVSTQILPEIGEAEIVNLTHGTPTPFTNLYQTPETLGMDRIAAMAAACMIYPDKAVLVFDIGTCMTIDLMHPDKTYRGGNISPGLEMRLKAMQTMTGKLPYAPLSEATGEAGTSTLSALANGALWGMKYEIEGYIAQYQAIYPDLHIVLCGGDISYFANQLKFKIFAAPDFVLHGLYHLLIFNEK